MISVGVAQQLQIKVEAPENININEDYFRIRYRINSAQESQIVSPNLKGFELLSGPNVSIGSETISINGKTESSSFTTYTYTLAPVKSGKFTISGAAIRMGGRTYKARPVTIHVSGSRQSKDNKDESSLPTSGKNLYITAQTSAQQVYEQQQILLTYRFYERPGVGLSSISLSKKPDFKGMVCEDIPGTLMPTTETINGVIYSTGIVQQYLISPQKEGKLSIPPILFDCVVFQREKGIDPIDAFFNGAGNISRTVTCSAQPISINVKPLPRPQPTGFSGGVGQFNAKGELLSKNPRSGDLLTYRITVSGSGNLKLLSAPTLTFPSDFDTYTPKVNDHTKVSSNGVTGEITFDYTFVPRNVGNYEIPGVNFTYFDPEHEVYVTDSIPPTPMRIMQGDRSNEDIARERELRAADIRPIHAPTPVVKGEHKIFWGTWTYWSIIGGMIVAFIIFCIILRNRLLATGQSNRPRTSKAMRPVIKELKEAEAAFHAGASEKGYGILLHATTEIIRIATHSNITPERTQMESLFKENGIDSEVASGLIAIYDECQFARYAPDSTSDNALSLIRNLREMTTQINKKKIRSGISAILLLVLLMMPAAVAHADKLLLRADSLYQAKEYTEATKLYEEARQQGFSGKDLYYNLGCAYYRQNNIPNAILNYERALRIDPSDEDVVYALRLSRSHITHPVGHTSTLFFVTWADRVVRSHGADQWGGWAIAAFAAALASTAAYLLLRRKWMRKVAFALSLFFLLDFTILTTASALQAHRYHNEKTAVVCKSTPLLSEEGHTMGQDLMPGVTVRVVNRSESQLQIEIPEQGLSGWIAAEDVKMVR